jgi:hypothetical protein
MRPDFITTASTSGPLDSKPLNWLPILENAVSEYVLLAEPVPCDQTLRDAPNAVLNNVLHALESEQGRQRNVPTVCKTFTAVVSVDAGTEAMDAVPNPNSPSMNGQEFFTLLRYANALDKHLRSIASSYLPSAFVFDAVRYMFIVAIQNRDLFLAVKAQFDDFNNKLRGLDLYLAMVDPTDVIKSIFARAMTAIVRFCALVTKHLKGIP